jgi:hypothetical protein
MAYDENGNVVPDPIPASDVLGEAVSTHPVLTQLKEQIASLEQEKTSLQNKYDYVNRIATERGNELVTLQNKIRTLIVDAVEEDELGKTKAREILDECGIEATKTVTISGTITFSGHVEVSVFDEDILDDVRYQTSVSDLTVDFNGEYLDNLEYETEDVEWMDY